MMDYPSASGFVYFSDAILLIPNEGEL
jgi:hypothetical protein